MKAVLSILATGLLTAGAATAATPYMSADWAVQACQGWNASAPLANELGAKWVKNDKNRGYKIIQMYRTDCGAAGKVEMKIVSQDGKAVCTYAGPVATAKLDYDVDYLMHATTKDWKSDMNPATAMMFGNLKFDGPKLEAMSVMGPFKAFMTLASKVPGEAVCPSR
ncbi:MAG TPA: SCP2 sterol-binding domain-containing protein [Thiobacillaceae bacterium]|nr:SCP2 sterol-binding domain-containing protein [Thiobacillaceae bacterium]